LKQQTYDTALHFGKALNAGADTVLAEFAELGQASTTTLKAIERLVSTTGFLGNSIKIEDALKDGPAGSQGGGLSQVIRKGATFINAATGILSIAQASAADRTSGDASYSGTMKAIGKSMGQVTVGVLATAGVAALAPASAPVFAVAVVGGAVVTGCAIVSGSILDYIMAR
jgi:hypothetical protein